MKVKDVMTKVPYCCMQTDTVQYAAELMRRHDVGAIPVVIHREDKKLIGIVTDRDICLKIIGAATSPLTKVSEAMTRKVVSAHPDDTLASCESQMELYQIRRIPVVDSSGTCVGIVSQADVALLDSAQHLAETVAAISRRRRVEQHASEYRSVSAA
ncbi:CBS domain-containing protein [Terriglobus roseus]|uniref:CBS domain-containing protein n=1 Tax=Terriglobus roseus TaxID=392734 RepID=A0A1H4KZC5_9BACT|nr:CBS domain-containing protein [Terriglobus roseus]SEB63857.1 CBS domain-containing protein [Terriglobus roseus]